MKGLDGISQVDKAFGREDEWFKNKPNVGPINLGIDLVAEEQHELMLELYGLDGYSVEEDRTVKLDYTPINVLKTAKEMADVIVVIQNLAKRLGIDLSIALDLVNNSNLTKLCSDPEKALIYGKIKYPDRQIGIKKLDNGAYMLYDIETGKFLKGYGYQEPNMAPACKVPSIDLKENVET